MDLKRDTYIFRAESRYGREVPVIVDSGYSRWVFVATLSPYGGTEFVIQAESWESAYEALIDYLPAIARDEVPEAYGCDSQDELDGILGRGEHPDLVEGYSYQSNSSGTGIVNTGHHLGLREYNPEHDRDSVKLRIGTQH